MFILKKEKCGSEQCSVNTHSLEVVRVLFFYIWLTQVNINISDNN